MEAMRSLRLNDSELIDALIKRGLKTWHLIVMADIIGSKLQPPQQKIEVEKLQTKIIDLANFTVTKVYNILQTDVRGRVDACVIVSPSSNYSVHLSIDGQEIFKTLDDLIALSPFLESIAAFNEDGNFILNIRDIAWINRFELSILVNNPITFSKIFMLYKLFVS
jgi:hypothetical protein